MMALVMVVQQWLSVPTTNLVICVRFFSFYLLFFFVFCFIFQFPNGDQVGLLGYVL